MPPIKTRRPAPLKAPGTTRAEGSSPAVKTLIEKLKLQKHPEGGWFGQVHVSADIVSSQREGARRPGLTSIYYLMERGDCSHWHQVKSDEVWNYHGGSPVEQFHFDPSSGQVRRHVIGPVEKGGQPQVVVKGGTWQASRPMGAYGFVGCAVGPGFQYEDFALMRENPALEALLKRRFPNLSELL